MCLHLSRLCLEWNGVGLQESSSQALCEGLAVNASLRYLDLRSNHVDHTSAAHIANMLLVNVALQELGRSVEQYLATVEPLIKKGTASNKGHSSGHLSLL